LTNSFRRAERVTTALLLAAGTGSRLYPLTENEPKCLTTVNGTAILERLIDNLNQNGFKRLVVVTGHLEHKIREFLGTRSGDISIEYLFSPSYRTTNNVYSLWMAREIINEPFLLLESDLVLDDSLLGLMLGPDRMAVAKMQPWMNGTYVTVNQSGQVRSIMAGHADFVAENRYKTVNIYSISLSAWRRIVSKLDQHVAAGNVDDYYEVVFAQMIVEGSLSFDIVSFDGKPWYEIDNLADLAQAEELFSLDDESAKPAVLSRPGILKREIPNAAESRQATSGTPNVTSRP
jgi:choline kinase